MRQFISEEFPDKDGILKIKNKDFRYFKQILRVKVGDMINIRLPDSSLENFTVCKIIEKEKELFLQNCTISSIENSITRGTKADEIENSSNFNIELYLFSFIAKPQKMELIIRQAVECGVKYIIPVISEYSQKSSIESLKSSKKERILRIIKESRQQSGSPINTEVLEPMTVEKACEFWKNQNQTGIVLWEKTENCKTLHEIFDNSDIKKVAIAVGSEGGISKNEIIKLSESNFIPVHFDINILRCETASLYGIAAVQSILLEKSKWQSTEVKF